MGKEAMEKDHLKKGEREATRQTGRGEDYRTASASDRGEDGRKSPDGQWSQEGDSNSRPQSCNLHSVRRRVTSEGQQLAD